MWFFGNVKVVLIRAQTDQNAHLRLFSTVYIEKEAIVFFVFLGWTVIEKIKLKLKMIKCGHG